MNRDVVADLHVHTTASDGSLDLEQAIDLAADRGLEAIAITDHDRAHPDLHAPVTQRRGVTVVRGMELKVACEDGWRVDLLAFGLRESEPIKNFVDRLQQDRMHRAARIRDCLEDELGLTLAFDIEPGIGRPHIARAVAEHPDASLSVQDVFDRYIGDGGPCFVARDVPSLTDGRAILEEAASVTALAHPLRYDDIERALDIAQRLGAIERRYPYDKCVDETMLDRFVRRHDLVVTGGSDAHDMSVGDTGLGEVEYRQFIEILESGA